VSASQRARSSPPPIEDLSVAKRIRLGFAGLVLASALGLVLRMLGLGEVTLILALAVAGIGLVMIAVMASSGIWSTIAAILVMVTPPFAVAVVIDVPLVGPVVETTVVEAPASRWAAGFILRDATLRADLGGTVTTARRGRGRAVFYDSFTAAPVVAADWRRGQLVTVWAVADGNTAPPEWSRPGGLIRVLETDKQDEVIDRLMRRHGLGTVPGRVIGRWVPDPAAARSAAWLELALLLGGACAAWALLCVLVRPSAPPARSTAQRSR
jgi:hypothetical protein